MQQKHPRDTLSVYLRIYADWCRWAVGVMKSTDIWLKVILYKSE
jgi:hypothetical protein